MTRCSSSGRIVLAAAIGCSALACAAPGARNDPTEPAVVQIQRFALRQERPVILPTGPLPDSIVLFVGGQRIHDTDSIDISNEAIHSVEILRDDPATAPFGPSVRVVIRVTVDSSGMPSADYSRRVR